MKKLTKMVDERFFVVLCKKSEVDDPKRMIYIAPRQVFEECDNEDFPTIPLIVADVENNVVKFLYDGKNEPLKIFLRWARKSELTEVE